MKLTFASSINAKNQLLIVPIFEDGVISKVLPKELNSLAPALKAEKEMHGKEGETFMVTPLSQKLPKQVLFIGFGKEKKLDGAKVRNSIAEGMKFARKHNAPKVSIYLHASLEKYLQELAEGAVLSNYNPAKFQTGDNKKKNEKSMVKGFEIITKKKKRDTIRKGQTIAEGVNKVRDFINAPHNLMDGTILTREARKIAKESKLKVTVLGAKQLEKLKMGALLGVNKGSAVGANLAILEHKPRGVKKDNPIVLVGKGVTFDSGGYNLKSGPWYADMKMDMSGAAVVLGVMGLCGKLNIPHHIIGMTPITDNLIDKDAQKVSDIVTSYSGKTIEVNNTDAEGRLILADTMSYAVDKYKPKMMIDIATLTGACVMALGEKYAGLFGNNEKLIEKLGKAGQETDELTWHMPIHPDHSKEMKSKIADLQNANYGGQGGGASTAAAFLQEFVGKTHWAHLDIAGTAFVKHPKKYESPMGTGYGVRLLTHFLENL